MSLLIFSSCNKDDGNPVIPNTTCPDVSSVTYSGKTYNTVQIGNQCWLKENLNVGLYVATTHTGLPHSNVSNNGIIEKYCYENNDSNCTTYGGLYDWNEAMGYVTTPGTQGICPPGWHIPTYAEFEELKVAVNYDGNTLKAIEQGRLAGVGRNTTGFSGLLVGIRPYAGSFQYLGEHAGLWSSSEFNSSNAYNLLLLHDDSSIFLHYYLKDNGYSIRCVKN